MAYFHTGLKRTIETNVGYHSNTISVVQVPTPHGSSARKYLLHEIDFDNVKKLLPSNIKFEEPKILMVYCFIFLNNFKGYRSKVIMVTTCLM